MLASTGKDDIVNGRGFKVRSAEETALDISRTAYSASWIRWAILTFWVMGKCVIPPATSSSYSPSGVGGDVEGEVFACVTAF